MRKIAGIAVKILSGVLSVALAATALPLGLVSASTEIQTATAGDKAYILGDVLYSTDFEDTAVGMTPDGWEIANTSWGHCTSGLTPEISATVTELGSYGNVLTYSANGVDTWVSMPEVNTRNYVFEATFVTAAGTTSGSFGIANGMYGGISSTTGALFTSVPVKYAVGGNGYYRSKGLPAVQRIDFTVPVKTPPGTVVKMKFVSLDGMNYYYIDDNFIGAFSQGDSDSTSDCPGFYTYNGTFHVVNTTVTEIVKTELMFNNVSLDVSGENAVFNTVFSFNKANKIYKENYNGNYSYSASAPIKFGVLAYVDDSPKTDLTVETEGVANMVFESCSESTENLYFEYNTAVFEENIDKTYTMRPYVLIGDTYLYGEADGRVPARIADSIYASSDSNTQEKISKMFANSTVFKGDSAKKLTFALFSDFHYKENMYTVSIADLRTILKRADDNNAAFIMSGGDFCNDFAGSPELTNTYLNYTKADGTTLTAYNIYGNHELETQGNSMENVTATLTNDQNVVWGTADGSYDCNIGYYYFESNGFRIVCTDTNYSLNSSGEWEHNLPASYGAASGNTKANSLGDTQLSWLEGVLTDAAEQGIPCIVMSHDGFSGKFATSSSDAENVRAIYSRVNAIRPGTVIMSINGHHHTNHQGYNEGVFYFDMNTTRNGYWKQMAEGSEHYADGQTYMYESYDSEGNLISTAERNINELYQAKNTWFFADPLSAIVTVDEFGKITIDGAESSWMYDVAPATTASGVEPKVTSGTFWDCGSLGHKWTEEWSGNETHHWYTCENESCTVSDVALNYGYAPHTFEEIESEEFLVEGTTALYYKSCVCGAVSEEYFGEGVPPLEVWDGSIADSFADGSGTSDDPYIIETAAQLARMVAVGDTAGGYYKIVKNIYLNNINDENWTENSPNSWFDRAYINNTAFVGNVDGTGHSIHGLYYNGTSIFGLLPQASNTTVRNVIISNSHITSTDDAAAFIGFPQNTIKFYSCAVDETVSIETTSSGGSASGYAAYGAPTLTVDSCTFTGSLKSANKIGAFAADCWSNSRTATNSFAVGYPFAGNNAFKATDCYNTVNETNAGTSIPTVLSSAELMQGKDALKNMPKLSGFVATDSYPTRFYNGTVGEVWSGAVAIEFASGEGTKESPYIIKTAEQLVKILNMADTSGKYFSLGADIILNESGSKANCWFDSNNSEIFGGTLDGKNYIISGLYYGGTATGILYTALFPTASGASVKNVILENSEIDLTSNSEKATYVGGIYGFLKGASAVTDCYIADSVTLSNKVAEGQTAIKTVIGGIVGGANCPVTVENCAFFGTLEYSEYRYGAVFGDTYTATSSQRIVKNTVVSGYTPSSKWSFTGSNNISTVAIADTIDTNSSFTVVESLKGEAGIAAVADLNSAGKYFGTEGYPMLSVLGRRFSDVNGDRECNSLDLAVMRKNLIGTTALGYIDINGDGRDNLKDLVALKKLTVK